MKFKPRHLASIVLLGGVATLAAQESTDVNYMPHIGGVIRTRWEAELDGGLNRFAVMNARVNLKGNIAKPIDYFLQADLCRQGTIQFLDGWARLAITPKLKIKVGQYRMPFGVDPFRAPGNYIFSNRSFIGRDLSNVRAVGADVAYTFDKIPLSIEAGVFNPTSIGYHTGYTSAKAYAAKAVYKINNVTLTTGFKSLEPDSVRINLADAAITYNSGRWLAEAEYMYKHYTNSAMTPCHAYNFYASYAMPVKLGVFNLMSFQGRFDGTTDHSTGTRNSQGNLQVDLPAVNRMTLGATITYVYKLVRLDFRLNYENYFYKHGVAPSAERDDKFVAEIALVI